MRQPIVVIKRVPAWKRKVPGYKPKPITQKVHTQVPKPKYKAGKPVDFLGAQLRAQLGFTKCALAGARASLHAGKTMGGRLGTYDSKMFERSGGKLKLKTNLRS